MSNNNIRNHSLSLRGWTRNARSAGKSLGLHPELLRLAADCGLEAVPTGAFGPRGPATSQAFIADVFVGYYPGAYGATSWQVGNERVCMSRRELVALLTEGTEPTETSPSARNLREVRERREAEEAKAEAKVKAEPKVEPKAEETKVASIQSPAIAIDQAALIQAVTAAVLAALSPKKE